VFFSTRFATLLNVARSVGAAAGNEAGPGALAFVTAVNKMGTCPAFCPFLSTIANQSTTARHTLRGKAMGLYIGSALDTDRWS